MLQLYRLTRHVSSLRLLSSNTPGGYLYESDVPTLHYQESLPRLPIPELADTCNRYLSAQRPLLDDIQFSDTMKIVRDFEKGIGLQLHRQLLAKDTTLDRRYSYIHDAWTEMYQCDRSSILLNQNPILTFRDDPNPTQNTQLNRATSLVLSTVQYFRTLRDGKLPPLKSCMMQFPHLFQSTRIPKPKRDEIVRFPRSRHLLVLRNGHYYRFDVLSRSGELKDSHAIKAALQEILSDDRVPNKNGLGYFTALERDDWVAPRAELNATNPQFMKAIDEAMFVLCLDDVETHSDEEIVSNGLVGDGCNRWFDKSFSLIVSKNGKAGVNWEHAWGDGATITDMMMEVYQDSIKQNSYRGDDDMVTVSKLDPVLTPNIYSLLEKAKESFDNAKNSYAVNAFNFGDFGKADFKNFKISPDSASQLIFQMAQWRHHQTVVGTYESCSTAGFRSGRTETIRPCTAETKQCSIAFDRDNSASLSEMAALLRNCSNKHSTLCKEAVQGQGFDRHLFALRHLQELNGGNALELFQDENYAKLSVVLSTSTVVSPCLQLYLTFGAVSQSGLGIGYLMDTDNFGCAVSCYPPYNSSSDFVGHLKTVCEDIHSVINGKNFKPTRKV